MKKILIVSAFLALPFLASANTLECPAGQIVQNVEVTPAVIGTPAQTHTVHHDAVTHEVVVIDTPASDVYMFVGFHQGDYLKLGNGNYQFLPHQLGSYNKVHHLAVTHTETVVDTEAYDEVVIDVPAVIATPAVTEEQCVDAPVVPVVVTPVITASVGSSAQGGHRHCGTSDTPSCTEWVKTLGSKPVTVKDLIEQIVALIKEQINLMK